MPVRQHGTAPMAGHHDTAALVHELTTPPLRMGAIKQHAKAIKADHALASDLWASGAFGPRLLATLVLDRKQLDQPAIDTLAADMLEHPEDECTQLADWLLANQLMKSKGLTTLLGTWSNHASPVLRRLFWYHQARLRWTGQTPPDNSAELLDTMERDLTGEHPIVQWAMNFCAGWIGVHEPALRQRCVALGETTGLYRDLPVATNCTPDYLPEFIRIEVAKRA